MIELDERGSKCFLDYFGYGIKNTTGEDSTCGLDPTDADLLTHGIQLRGLDCASIISSDVLSFLRVECTLGIPRVQLELTFPQYLSDELYTCEIRPTCTAGFLFSWIVCHTSKQSFLSPVSETLMFENSAGPRSSSTLFTWIVFSFIVFMMTFQWPVDRP